MEKWKELYFKWKDVDVYEACLKILMDECVNYHSRFQYEEYCVIYFVYDDVLFNSMRETIAEMYDYDLKAEEL